MSLRRFLNVAYAILVEEYQRMGIDLISALEKVSELGEASRPEGVEPSPPKPASVRQNEQSMAALKGMLANVANAPGSK